MKLPKHAKRVYKGKIFEVYEWRQKEFDGSYQTYELVRRADTVQIIATQNGKILMTRERQPGHLRPAGLLGGRIEKDEKPLTAAKRELLEEAGLISRDWEAFAVYQPYRRIVWKIYVFLARNCHQAKRPRPEAGEKIKLLKLNFGQFLNRITRDYWRGDLVSEILRLKQEPKRLSKFRRKVFGQSRNI